MHAGGTDSKTLQQYIKLLDDNSDDFGDERQLDKLRIAVVKHIRENQVTENQVNELDSKIALLVKNRITLEEVVHFSSKQMRSHLAHEVAQQHEREGGVITLKGNDKETKNKRQRYEEMFYLLQTQPQYLSKLMFTMNKTSGSGATKFLEGAVLTMYGYVQNSREEYLFLNLIDSSLVIEIEDLEKIDDFWKDNPLFIKLALQYIRGAKERKFLRDFLQPLVKGVLGDANLDLETDAQKVHKELIRSEEIRTGEKSTISADISAADAAELPAVKALITERFANLKRITNSFLAAIVNSLSAMPFGIRYVANKMKEHLSKRFPGHEHELEINRILGNLLYYRYINPAIIAPDAFDVIESSTISPVQRKNLAEVAKVLNSIQSSRTIPGADMLNEFITSATGRFSYFIKEATQVESLDEFFGMNEFVDMSLAVKPTIYITPDEIIQIHCNLVENISQICQGDQDPLKVILTEMGTAPTLDSGAKGPGSELTLHLTNRFAKSEHPEEARNRQLISEAKILIQAIVRISAGKSLLKILETPVDADMQSSFTHFLEASQKRLVEGSGARSSESVQINAGTSLHYLKNSDDSFFTFAQLKCRAIEKMAELEQLGLCTQKDEYQSMMDSIVEDMLNKQRRRSQRKREMKVLLSTLSNLQEKAAFLGDQKKSYDDYISACMQQLQSKTKT